MVGTATIVEVLVILQNIVEKGIKKELNKKEEQIMKTI